MLKNKDSDFAVKPLNHFLQNQSDRSFKIFCKWSGSIPFEHSLNFQKQLKKQAQHSQFCFFGFECSQPVVTLGLRAVADHILWTKDQLQKHRVSTLNIKRGGEATLHAPGQLVIYPVIHLPSLSLKVRDWIKALESITQSLLQDLGILAWTEGKYAGLYTKTGKIAFFGIHISEGVSQHGLSINVNNDLNLFHSIMSCGEAGRRHDKLSLYPQISLSSEELFSKWCEKALAFLSKEKKL